MKTYYCINTSGGCMCERDGICEAGRLYKCIYKTEIPIKKLNYDYSDTAILGKKIGETENGGVIIELTKEGKEFFSKMNEILRGCKNQF